MNNAEIKQFVIATEEELLTLFKNEAQREIFKIILKRIVHVLVSRTSLNGVELYVR